ncbi:hypothetical protein DFQ27_004773 [Actinomortierella ambigua]|uniref:HAUS augmin-like complex subunit 6 N-terminal domain-containing protein n=1 Tax=Actinomortierella ambigua TaxID=1343610 RepID=A0A9P6Q2Y5_9FUNG|nr:hypothetical protein DFQ27_004773 [Actinomortierella ambigua]
MLRHHHHHPTTPQDHGSAYLNSNHHIAHNAGGNRQGLTMADLLYPRRPATVTSQPSSSSSSSFTGSSKPGHGGGTPAPPLMSKMASTERVRSTFFTNLILLGIDSYGDSSSLVTPDQPPLSSSGSIVIQPFQHPQSVDHVTIDPTFSTAALGGANTTVGGGRRHPNPHPHPHPSLLGMSTATPKARPLTVSRDMFARSNQSTKALEFVLWFLLDKLDPLQCRERCKGCWPIMDRHDAREFRNVVFKWLDELRKEGCFAVGHGGVGSGGLNSPTLQQHKQPSASTTSAPPAPSSSSSTIATTTATSFSSSSSSVVPGVLTVRPTNENTELGGSTFANASGLLWSRLCINGMDVMATIRRSYLDESTGERIEQIILVLSTFVLWVNLQRQFEKNQPASTTTATTTTTASTSSTWSSKRTMDLLTAHPTSKAELDTMGRQLQQEEHDAEVLFGLDLTGSSKANDSLEELRSLKKTLDRRRREAKSREECHQKERELSRRPFRRLLDSLPSTEVASAGSFRPLDRGARTEDDFKLLLGLGSGNGNREEEATSPVRQHRMLESMQEAVDSRIQQRTPARLSQLLDGQSEQDLKSAFTIRTHRPLPAMSMAHAKSGVRSTPSVWTDPRVTMTAMRGDIQGRTETKTTTATTTTTATHTTKSIMGSLFARSTAPSNMTSQTLGARPVAADLVVAHHNIPAMGREEARRETTTPYGVQRGGTLVESTALAQTSFAPRWSLSRKRQQSSLSPVRPLLVGKQDGVEDDAEISQGQMASPSKKTPTLVSEPGFADQDVFGTPKKRRRTGMGLSSHIPEGPVPGSVRLEDPSTVAMVVGSKAGVGAGARTVSSAQDEVVHTQPPTIEEGVSDPMAVALAKSPIRHRGGRGSSYTVPSSQLLTLDDLRAPTPKVRRTKDGTGGGGGRSMPLMLLHTPQQRKLFGMVTPLGSKDDRHDRSSSPMSPVRPLLFSPKSPAAEVVSLAPAPTSPAPVPASPPTQHGKASAAALFSKGSKRPEFGASVFARFQPSFRGSQASRPSFGKAQEGLQGLDRPSEQQQRSTAAAAAAAAAIGVPLEGERGGEREGEQEQFRTTATTKRAVPSSILDRLYASSSKSDSAKSVLLGSMSAELGRVLPVAVQPQQQQQKQPPLPRMASSQFEPMERMRAAAPAAGPSSSSWPSSSSSVSARQHRQQQQRDGSHVHRGSVAGPWSTSSSSLSSLSPSPSSSSSMSFSSLASGSTMGPPALPGIGSSGASSRRRQPPRPAPPPSSNPWGRPPSWKPSSPRMIEMDKQRRAEKAKRRAAREVAMAALSMELSSSRIGTTAAAATSGPRAPLPLPMAMRSTPTPMTTTVAMSSGGSMYQEMVVPLNDAEEDGSQEAVEEVGEEEEEKEEGEGRRGTVDDDDSGGDEAERDQDMDESSPSPVSPLRFSSPFRPLGESTFQKDTGHSSSSLSSSRMFSRSTNASTTLVPPSGTSFFQRARKLSMSASVSKPIQGRETAPPPSRPRPLPPAQPFMNSTGHSQRRLSTASQASYRFAEPEQARGGGGGGGGGSGMFSGTSAMATAAEDEEADEPTIYNLALQNIFGSSGDRHQQSSGVRDEKSSLSSWNHRSKAAYAEGFEAAQEEEEEEDNLGGSLSLFDLVNGSDQPWSYNSDDDEVADRANSTQTHGLLHEPMPGSLDPDEVL